jgi:hypothetical protein
MADEEQPSGEKSPFGAFEQEPVREREAAPAGLRVRRGLRGGAPLVVVLMVAAVVGGVAMVSQDGGDASDVPTAGEVARPAADAVRFAKQPPTPRPSSGLPRAVARASPDSRLATRFVTCDGLRFFVQSGRFPTVRDWESLPGGYVLSRAPTYRARQIGATFTKVMKAPDQEKAAVRRSGALGCAAF